MDIMELGAIGELVGGAAVIVSLVYVGLQLRQSNELAVTRSHEEANRASTDLVRLYADPINVDLFVRMAEEPEGMSNQDRVRQRLLLTGMLNYYETLYYANERRAVHAEVWESRVDRMSNLLHFGLREQWADMASSYGSSFRAFIEREVIALETVPPISGLPGPAGVRRV